VEVREAVGWKAIALSWLWSLGIIIRRIGFYRHMKIAEKGMSRTIKENS
jgi:hypothetical protein